MKPKIFICLILTAIVQFTYAQKEIIEKIENKTWFEDTGFAGTTIVFYMTSNGIMKAIKQKNGSGVPVISSAIYDVEIQDDTIFLMNGIDLKTSGNLPNYKYKYDKQTGLIESLRIIFNKSILFSWTVNKKSVTTQLDVTQIAKIDIKENEIYQEEDLVKILIE